MKVGHPKGKRNAKRTKEEKAKMVIEYLEGEEGYEKVAKKQKVDKTVFRKWIQKYRKNGIEGLQSQTGKHKNPKCGKYNRHPSEIEKLREEVLKKEIEIERLKKGYQVKGDGAKKEYDTIFNANTKSLKR